MSVSPVLYVEDEEADAFFLQLAFQNAKVDHPLKVLINGQQAIDYLQGVGPFSNREEHPLPCLVLLDINLPLLSGMEVLQWIREQPRFRTLPVVMYTSSSNEADVEKARSLGIQDYLLKASNPAETTAQVEGLKRRWLSQA